jgi:hypothetical protein
MSDVPLLKRKYNAFRVLKADFEKEIYEQTQGFFANDVIDALRKLNQDLTIEIMWANKQIEVKNNYTLINIHHGFRQGINKAIELIEKRFGILDSQDDSVKDVNMDSLFKDCQGSDEK